jgi:hypothetical protein
MIRKSYKLSTEADATDAEMSGFGGRAYLRSMGGRGLQMTHAGRSHLAIRGSTLSVSIANERRLRGAAIR